MSKKVVVISTSLRANSNSEALAKELSKAPRPQAMRLNIYRSRAKALPSA